MPLPGPHGSASHSFTSGRIGRPGDIRDRLRVPVIPWATPPGHPPPPSPTVLAHQRSSGAADVTGSPGCSGMSNPRGQAHTVRGHRYSGSIGTHPSLQHGWIGSGECLHSATPQRRLLLCSYYTLLLRKAWSQSDPWLHTVSES